MLNAAVVASCTTGEGGSWVCVSCCCTPCGCCCWLDQFGAVCGWFQTGSDAQQCWAGMVDKQPLVTAPASIKCRAAIHSSVLQGGGHPMWATPGAWQPSAWGSSASWHGATWGTWDALPWRGWTGHPAWGGHAGVLPHPVHGADFAIPRGTPRRMKYTTQIRSTVCGVQLGLKRIMGDGASQCGVMAGFAACALETWAWL